MKKWMILLLAIALVAAGAFLPELLLKASPLPEPDINYQPLSISSQSSSDYTWRMERIAEHFFGEGEHVLFTYISEETPEQGSFEGHDQFLRELERLTELGVLPEQVISYLDGSERYPVSYTHLTLPTKA